MAKMSGFNGSRGVGAKVLGVLLLTLTFMPPPGWADALQSDASAGTAAGASAGTAVPADLEKLTFYEPAGKPFSLWIPEVWEQTLYDFLKAHQSWELKMFPGGEGLSYVLIEVNYYANRHKSPERYISDRIQSPVQELNFKGYPARTFEFTTDRMPPLGMEGENPIPVVKKYIVVPLDVGYITLVYDAPRSLAEEFRPYFDDVLSSLTLPERAPQTLSEAADVTPEEYAVYTNFLTPLYRNSESGDSDRLDDLFTARLVGGKTIQKGAPQGEILQTLRRTLGPLDDILIRHYSDRNNTARLIMDKINVPGLEIDAQSDANADADADADADANANANANADADANANADADADAENDSDARDGADGPVDGAFEQKQPERLNLRHLSGRIDFSRVGFSVDGKTALFYASRSGGGPTTGHYVVMDQREGHWVVRGALRVEYLIH